MDRATLAAVLARLEARKLGRRKPSRTDGRLRLVMRTPAGGRLLAAMAQPARRAHDRTVEALSPKARAAFTAALHELVEAGNGHGRAALRIR